MHAVLFLGNEESMFRGRTCSLVIARTRQMRLWRTHQHVRLLQNELLI